MLAPLMLAIFGAWSYSKELVVDETHFQFLAKPHSLPIEATNHFHRKLTAVEVTMRVNHQMIRPGWWGESENLDFVPRDLTYTDGASKAWGIYYQRTRFHFDEPRQQYIVVFEGLVPYEDQGATGKIKANFKIEKRSNVVGSFLFDVPVKKISS